MLAAGLGTRMKSSVPKVLHAAVRPADDRLRARRRRRGDRARGRSSSTRPRPRRSATPSRAAPTSPSRTSHAGPVTPSVPRSRPCPRRPRRSSSCRATCRSCEADLLSALLEARALDHAAMALVAVDAIDPTGLGRVVRERGRDGRADRRGQGRHRRGAPDHRGQRRPVRASTRPGSGAGSATSSRRRRPASCTSPTSSRSPARTAGSWPRSRSTTTGGSRASTTAAQLARAEWDMRVELNDRWMKAGVTMVDPSTVYLDHGVELAEDVILEPNVVLRGATTDRGADPDRERAPRSSTRRSARTASSGRASSSARPSRTTSRSARSPPPAGRPRRQPLGDRQLRRDQEQPPRRRTSASTT